MYVTCLFGGMIVIDNLLNKICQVVRIIGGNTVVKARFQHNCKARNKSARMFGIDVKHRWNTTYLLLHRLDACQNEDADDDENDEFFILTDQDWDMATRVRKFLKPFYNATVQLSGIYCPTSCLVLEWIWKLALVFNENRSD